MSASESRRRASLARAALAVPICATLALCGVPARADTVTLHNGDRLTGRILHLSPATLTFETTWAGELKIPRYEVRAIETDKPVTVLRERAVSTQWATLKPAGAGRVVLVPGELRPAPPAESSSVPETAPVGAAPPVHETPPAVATPPVTIPLTQVRYLNPRPEESGEGVSYEGRLTVSGVHSRGNDSSERLYAEGDLGARARDWRYAINGKLKQERDEGVSSASNWLVSGHFDRFLDEHDFGYLRGSIERDRFRDLARRTSVGAGYGRQLLQTPRASVSLRGGLDGIDVRRFAGDDASWPALGWGLEARYRLDTWSAELFHEQQGFWNLEDTAQVTLRSRSGVRVPFASGLTASLQLNFDWDRVPATGRHAADATWLLGLGYAW